MRPEYEGDVLEVFARLAEEGLVYRDLKPVHWSIENRTALADAELEYYDRTDTSIHVLFLLRGSERLPAGLHAPSGKRVWLMIWTTTPWTLPANEAIVVAPAAEYSLIRFTGRSRIPPGHRGYRPRGTGVLRDLSSRGDGTMSGS